MSYLFYDSKRVPVVLKTLANQILIDVAGTDGLTVEISRQQALKLIKESEDKIEWGATVYPYNFTRLYALEVKHEEAVG